MAMIISNKFNRIEKERNSVHKPTTTTYTSFTIDDKHYFQIDTYGSTDRAMPEKISQSLQIDKEVAGVLIKILKQEFNID